MKDGDSAMGQQMVVYRTVSILDATVREGFSGKMTIELILMEKKKPAV